MLSTGAFWDFREDPAKELPKLNLITMLLLPTSAAFASGGVIVVPNAAANQEGNDESAVPFVILVGITARYQQVFDASQFTAIPSPGAFITSMYFRPDCVFNNGGSQMTNLLINLSTTSKGPDQLSAVFAENVGADDQPVFGPGNLIAGGNGQPTNNCPHMLFTGISLDSISLDMPFFYNPAAGNLLLDARVSGVNRNFPGGAQLDAVNVLGDSVSRVYAAPVDATVAAGVDTLGLVTGFSFSLLPALTNTLTTNAVVITWPVHPKNFLLQSAASVGPNVTWQLYTNLIGGGAVYHVLSLARDSLDQASFFRLACPSCPPISPSTGSIGTTTIKQPMFVQ
jgi:hypothetical protein